MINAKSEMSPIHVGCFILETCRPIVLLIKNALIIPINVNKQSGLFSKRDYRCVSSP